MAKAKIVFEKELPRGKFCIYQEAPSFFFLKLKQTHSAIVLNELNCHDEAVGDAIVGQSNTPLAIVTADCLPILILGKNGHSFIHAGWRGLQNQILKHELIKDLRPYYAFIGPHISMKNYEVQNDFKDNFPYPEVFQEKDEKIFFNLAKMAKIQLQSLFPEITIEESGICTFDHPDFQSFRLNKTSLRNWNIYIPFTESKK